MLWWVVDDARARLNGHEESAAVLRAFADRPMPFRGEAVGAWRANGLRVASVPRRELAGLKERLNLVGPNQDQEESADAKWRALVSGAPWGGAATVALDNGPLELAPGRLRLLARCWVVPVAPAVDDAEVKGARNAAREEFIGAALHVEIVPQHEERSPARTPLESAGSAPSEARLAEDIDADLRRRIKLDPREAGLVFSRLLLAGTLSADDCLVLVPEEPGADWSRVRRPDRPDATAGEPRIAEDRGSPDTPTPMGATLGETMLTDHFDVRHGRKLIVVLIPGAPERFTLLPAATPRRDNRDAGAR